jgi:two-component system, OmpR family, response regulator
MQSLQKCHADELLIYMELVSNSGMKALLIEDDRKITSFVKKALKEHGFVVETCDNGDDGYALASGQVYDVILLDIMLPGRDGLSILRGLREKKIIVPVILLTARSALQERVEGLNLGADDYLSKPFYVEELLARIHAVTRRATGDQMSLMQVGPLTVNLLTRDVKVGKEKVELTVREFSLLELLMRSPGRVFSRTQILEHVWGYDFDPQTNAVDVYIRRLRSKIDTQPNTPIIETIRGVGYRMIHPGKE